VPSLILTWNLDYRVLGIGSRAFICSTVYRVVTVQCEVRGLLFGTELVVCL